MECCTPDADHRSPRSGACPRPLGPPTTLVHSSGMVDSGEATSARIGSARDPAFLRAVRPILELYAAYFRSEVRGFERLPERGPILVVGNHSGGQMPPDIPILLTAWWRERGEDEPVYALFHHFLLAIPGVGPLLERAGAVEAGPLTAEAILNDGGILFDYPGGDYEVFRPWWERNRIRIWGSARLHPTCATYPGSDRPRRLRGIPRDSYRSSSWTRGSKAPRARPDVPYQGHAPCLRAATRYRSRRDTDMAASCEDHRRTVRTNPLVQIRP